MSRNVLNPRVTLCARAAFFAVLHDAVGRPTDSDMTSNVMLWRLTTMDRCLSSSNERASLQAVPELCWKLVSGKPMPCYAGEPTTYHTSSSALRTLGGSGPAFDAVTHLRGTLYVRARSCSCLLAPPQSLRISADQD